MNCITGSGEDDRKPQFKILTSASRLHAIYMYSFLYNEANKFLENN